MQEPSALKSGPRKIVLCLRTASVDPDAYGVVLECQVLSVQIVLLSPEPGRTEEILKAMTLADVEVVHRGGYNSGSRFSTQPWKIFFSTIWADVLLSEEPLACRFLKFARRISPGNRPVVEINDGVVFKRPVHSFNSSRKRVWWSRLHSFLFVSHFIANSNLVAATVLGRRPSIVRHKLRILQYPRFRIWNKLGPSSGVERYILVAPTKKWEHLEYNDQKDVTQLLFSKKFAEFARERGLKIAFRSHVVEQEYNHVSLPAWVVNANDGENFPSLAHAIAECKLFVTDYSSAYVDALAAGKPLLFIGAELPQDRVSSVAVWPGPRVTEISQLVAWAGKLLSNSNVWEKEREISRELLLGTAGSETFVGELLKFAGKRSSSE